MIIREEHSVNDEYQARLQIMIKTSHRTIQLCFVDGEPEDNSLSRNFSDAYLIGEILEVAYNAGKRGEVFDFKSEQIEW